MADEYELKQVKVRLKLSEAEPLYSTEQITTPDKAAEVMAQALAQLDREYCCVVNLDGANHPINFNVVSIGDIDKAQVPIQNVFKSAILSNAASIMLFHNHPSGSTSASRDDIEVTKRLIEAGKIMNIPVLDHIIVAGGTADHFSFRNSNPDMFTVREEAEYSVREPQAKLDPDSSPPKAGDSFTIYQLKDDESLRYIRFEGLDRIKKEGNTVDKDNYNIVYEAPMKPGTTLDDLYFQFNMQRPLDFRGHSMSVSDVVVLHQGEEDKAFYVDRFGFTELPDFLREREAEHDIDTIGSLTEKKEELKKNISSEKEKMYAAMEEDGGPSDRTDRLQSHINRLEDELAGVTESLQTLLDEQEFLAFADEAAYKLGDRYISIQRTDEGYDYSIFDEAYHLLDGGVYDNPDVSIGEVLQEITDELKQPIYDEAKDTYSHSAVQGNIRQSDMPVSVDYAELMEKTEEAGLKEIDVVKSAQEVVEDFRSKTEQMFHTEDVDGMRPSDIEEAVRNQVQQVIEDYGLDARIDDVIVSGSRCRGIENKDSDLDVVVSFVGTEREDDFFNLLHDEKMYFGSVELDINPISTEQTGTLAEYLSGVEAYLSEKAAVHTQEKVIQFPEAEKPEQIVTFTVAESSEFHSFGELHEGIPNLQDAIKIYEKICEESKLNAIPALGINLHTVGTPEYEDVQWDFLSGGRLDLNGLMFLPEMSQNAEVMEALHELADTYTDIRIEGRFPEETEQGTFGPWVQKLEELTEQLESTHDRAAVALAIEIDDFAFQVDRNEYIEFVGSREKNVSDLVQYIETGETEGVVDYLKDLIRENDNPETVAQAKEYLKKIDEYKPLAKVEELVEQNYNMIDDRINNLPPDPEEKKEPAPQKTMRIEEHKKVRKRVSMKAKIEEKKAIIAQNGGAPEQDKKPPHREV